MSRIEENKIFIESIEETINELYEKRDDFSADNIRNIDLGSIVAILADISKSLAVIADALNKED